jgi:uncharacterized membrane protein YfcA
VFTDPAFLLAAFGAVLLIGLAKGGFAGIGMAATPLLALAVPPLQAVAILLPILLVQDVVSVWWYRRDWDAWNLKVLLPGAGIGVCLAWALAYVVSDDIVRLAIGLIGVVFTLRVWFGNPSAVEQPSAASGMFWGAGAGFTSTIAQAGTPPFQVHMLPQHLDKMTLVGTTTMFFAAVNVMKVVPYFALGQFSGDTFFISAVLLPLAIATNFLGFWLVRKTPTGLFYGIAYALVFVISAAVMAQGVIGLWRALTL